MAVVPVASGPPVRPGGQVSRIVSKTSVFEAMPAKGERMRRGALRTIPQLRLETTFSRETSPDQFREGVGAGRVRQQGERMMSGASIRAG